MASGGKANENDAGEPSEGGFDSVTSGAETTAASLGAVDGLLGGGGREMPELVVRFSPAKSHTNGTG
jgi:hypothetical protein